MGKNLHLQYWNTCIFNGKIWFSNLEFNGIFSIDCETLTADFHGHIPFLEKNAFCAYSFCCNKGKYIYFAPNDARKLLVYDTENGSFQGLDLVSADSTEIYTTIGIADEDGCLWIFPKYLNMGIWRINTSTLKAERDTKLEQRLAGLEYGDYLIKAGNGRVVLLTSANELMEIHLHDKTAKKVKRFDKEISIFRVYLNKGEFWLIQKQSTDILRWNPESDMLIKYTLSGEAKWIRQNGIPYAGLFFTEQAVYVLNYHLYAINKIDLNESNGVIRAAFEYPSGFHFIPGRLGNFTGAFHSCDRVGKYLFFHPARVNMLLVYNMEDHTVKGKKLTVPKEEFAFVKEEVVYETDYGVLEFFIQNLCD